MTLTSRSSYRLTVVHDSSKHASERSQRQECSFPFEVVVVDDGSPAAVTVRPRGGFDLRVVRTARSGPAAARNAGAASARGEILAFTDDDCCPARDWLASLERALEAQPQAIVAGVVRNGLPDNRFAETSQGLVSYLVSYYEDGARSRFFTSNNFGVRRATFDDLGGFDTRYTRAAAEDRELCARAHDRGVPVVIDHSVTVDHHHDLNARSFAALHFRYGRGARRYHHARHAAGGARVAESPAFYTRLAAAPLRSGASRRACTSAGLLAVSQVCHALGYLVEGVVSSSKR